jgi:hypothetical protein
MCFTDLFFLVNSAIITGVRYRKLIAPKEICTSKFSHIGGRFMVQASLNRFSLY